MKVVDVAAARAGLADKDDLGLAYLDALVAKHTREVPEGLATRLRVFGEKDVHAGCDGWSGRCHFAELEVCSGEAAGEAKRCDEARALLRDATPEACAALDQAEESLAALRGFAEAFALTAEAAVRAHETRNPGGQQVSYMDDFAHITPSVAGRLRWWAARAREALDKTGGSARLRSAILAFTIDAVTQGMQPAPNGPAEDAWRRLADALIVLPDPGGGRVATPVARYLEANIERLRELREAAEEFFGGDFRSPPGGFHG